MPSRFVLSAVIPSNRWPANTMEPASMRYKPVMQSNRVVFPALLGSDDPDDLSRLYSQIYLRGRLPERGASASASSRVRIIGRRLGSCQTARSAATAASQPFSC
jgi:hypothetical protein